MPVRIRLANLESDRTALIEVMRRNLTANSNARFRWLYSESPHGRAQAWAVIDDGNGDIVGAAAAFPRKLYFDGKETNGVVLGDFCINEKHRSLGPALQLQRSCMSAISEGPFEFFYDFPSRTMTAIYSRLGIQPAVQFVRWAILLRAREKLERLTGSRGFARTLSPFADLVLAMCGQKGNEKACDLQIHEGPCGEEFTVLDNRTRSLRGVRTARTAAYLNWRYLSHPLSRYQILTARKKGNLVGYVVYVAGDKDSKIVDMSSLDDPAVILRLLRGAVEQLLRLGATTVSLCASNTHPWSQLYEQAGFRRRESAPVIVHVRDKSAVSVAMFQRDWFLMHGDRDS